MPGASGYVKLWRKLLSSPEWRSLSEGQRCVMITLLLKASWKEEAWTCRRCHRQEILHVGDCAVSERELAEAAVVSRKVVRTALAQLFDEKLGFGARKWAQCHSVITIHNFKAYQSSEDATGPEVGPLEGPQVGPVSLYEEDQEGVTRDPSSTTHTTVPTCLLNVAERQLELGVEYYGAPRRGSKWVWGQRYVRALLDSLPPGAPIPSESEYQEYSERLRAALEHAFSEDCRAWSDGSPYRDHVRTPAQLFRCLDELLDDLDGSSSSSSDDYPRAPTDPIPGESYADYRARIARM